MLEHACAQLFKEFQPDKDESSFQLHLALINIVHVHGEEGDVAGVRAQMASFLEKYGDKEENAVSYAYVALLKALRSVPLFVLPAWAPAGPSSARTPSSYDCLLPRALRVLRGTCPHRRGVW